MHNFARPVIGFVAPSGSGKTTLLKRLVPILARRGLRIGYLKHAHHTFDLDTPGKDSYEIRAAGAKQTLLASRQRWALQCESTHEVEDPSLDDMLRRFDAGSLDLILAEGFKHASYPKIEIYRIPAAGSPLYRLDANVIAVVTNGTLPEENHPPALPLADPQAVADFVQRYIASWSPPHSLGPSQDLVRYYRWLRQHGCNDSHSGNASVRMGERFLITPTGACADTLEPSELLSCPLAGPCPQSASLDAPLHQLVYQRQPEAKAVLHSHGPYSVAMSLAGADFLPIDFEGQSYFARVPVLTVPVAEYAHKAPGAVAAALAEHPIVMVRGHGVYAWGHTLNRAYKWTCSLELSAKTFFIATRLVDP